MVLGSESMRDSTFSLPHIFGPIRQQYCFLRFLWVFGWGLFVIYWWDIFMLGQWLFQFGYITAGSNIFIADGCGSFHQSWGWSIWPACTSHWYNVFMRIYKNGHNLCIYQLYWVLTMVSSKQRVSYLSVLNVEASQIVKVEKFSINFGVIKV